MKKIYVLLNGELAIATVSGIGGMDLGKDSGRLPPKKNLTANLGRKKLSERIKRAAFGH